MRNQLLRLIDRGLARIGLYRQDNAINAMVFLREQERIHFEGDALPDKTYYHAMNIVRGRMRQTDHSSRAPYTGPRG